MTPSSRNRLLALLFFGVLMAAMDIAIVGPALPAIRQAFGVTDRQVIWVFVAYLLLNLIGTPLMAKLSDRFGRRNIYVLDVSLFALGSVVVALAPTLPIVIVGRGLQGFGAGGIFPVASAVIGDTFPPERRGRALGLIGMVFGIAFMIGPILGGLLLRFGWQMLFWGPLPFALVLIPWAWKELPPAGDGAHAGLDWAGLAVLSALLTALAWGLNHLETERLAASARSTQVWPFLVAAAALLPLLAWIEHRAADPLIRPSLLGSWQQRLAGALAFGAGVLEGATVFYPSTAVEAFGVRPHTASLMLLPMVLALAVGAPAFGRLLDAWGSKRVVALGTALVAAALAVIGLPPLTRFTFYLSGLLTGLGLSALLGAPLRYIMLNEAPASERASAQGLISILTKIGQMLTGALVGAVAASFGGGVQGYQAAFRVLLLVALILALLAVGLKSRQAEQATLLPS